MKTMTSTRKLLAVGLLALPMAIALPLSAAPSTSPSTSGGSSCSDGKCGGPNAIEKMEKLVDSVKSAVENGDLEQAYDKVKSTAEEADKLNVESNSKVREWLAELYKTLVERTDKQYEEHLATYESGEYDTAIEGFKVLAEMTGLPAAKKSAEQIELEPHRKDWRQALASATQQINDAQHAAARESIIELKRLARHADYRKKTDEIIEGFNKPLEDRVANAANLVERQQYEQAYTLLIEISRIGDARKSASAARLELRKHQNIEGMKIAEREYDAAAALAGLNDWYKQLGTPSKNETEKYRTQLAQISEKFEGTRAAEKASEMLVSDESIQQAAR